MGPSLNCLSMHGCRCDSLKVYLAVCWLSMRQSILEIQVMRYQWIFDWGDQKWGKKIMKLRSWISSLHRADYDTKRVYQIHRTVDSRVHITGCNGLKQRVVFLTHWGRVTYICVSKLTIIGSDNGLSPERRQAIIWTNAGILLIRTLGTNFSEILGEIHSFSFSKMHLKMSSAKWRLFGLGLNELIAEHATLVMTVSNKGHSFQPVSFRKNQKKCFLSEIAIPINRHVINVMRDPLA